MQCLRGSRTNRASNRGDWIFYSIKSNSVIRMLQQLRIRKWIRAPANTRNLLIQTKCRTRVGAER